MVCILDANTASENLEQWSHDELDIPSRDIPIGNCEAEDKSWKSGMLPENGRWRGGIRGFEGGSHGFAK